MSLILGIDPGLSGGLGWIDGDDAKAVVMPTLNGEPDLRALADIYLTLSPSMVVLEQAQAARTAGGAGGANGFKIGVNFGLILGQLRERGLPVTIVHPASWKKAMKLSPTRGDRKLSPKETKDKAVALARDLFPSVDLRASSRCRIDHDGMAEGLLLAEYGRRCVVLPADLRSEP